jgi:hypothetical protein
VQLDIPLSVLPDLHPKAFVLQPSLKGCRKVAPSGHTLSPISLKQILCRTETPVA